MRDMSKMLAMGSAAGVHVGRSVCVPHDVNTGLSGIPTMSNEELMAATLEDAKAKQVPAGKVRRKRGRTAMLELAKLRSGNA